MAMGAQSEVQRVERWGIFELATDGPQEGNPFQDVRFGARFSRQHRTLEVAGFYDGDGTYRVRCMPDSLGEWRYVTHSNVAALDGQAGTFTCVAPGPRNHGPVHVQRGYHFAYADGAPYWQVGTTCYAWAHQGDALEAQTLATLKSAPFNKLRMCVFPKHYAYNQNEPVYDPYVRLADGGWDFTRFSPAFFRHFEQLIGRLRDLGIEADLILFHPYDRWGYAQLDASASTHYLRYLVARVAAYRNVWWSLANEYDLMRHRTLADWDRDFRTVQEQDPYQHPRSVHNCHAFYDHAKPWVTHQSIQRSDVENARAWRELYKKPVVVDECCYEGNIPQRWGDITAPEMVRRCWEVTVRGSYAGHGETYLHPEDILWWSKGGVLRGASPARLAFLRRILEEGPAAGLDPLDKVVEFGFPCAGQPGEYYLTYTGLHQPARMSLLLPEGRRFRAEIIDTWEMTITPVEALCEGRTLLALPGKPHIAVRLRGV